MATWKVRNSGKPQLQGRVEGTMVAREYNAPTHFSNLQWAVRGAETSMPFEAVSPLSRFALPFFSWPKVSQRNTFYYLDFSSKWQKVHGTVAMLSSRGCLDAGEMTSHKTWPSSLWRSFVWKSSHWAIYTCHSKDQDHVQVKLQQNIFIFE